MSSEHELTATQQARRNRRALERFVQQDHHDRRKLNLFQEPRILEMDDDTDLRQLGYTGLLAPIRKLHAPGTTQDEWEGLMISPDADPEVHRHGADELEEFFDFKRFEKDRRAVLDDAMQRDTSAASTQHEDMHTPDHNDTQPTVFSSFESHDVSNASKTNMTSQLIPSSPPPQPQQDPVSITPTPQPYLPSSVLPWSSAPNLEQISGGADAANLQGTHTALQTVLNQVSDIDPYVGEENRFPQLAAPTSTAYGLEHTFGLDSSLMRPASVETTPAMQLQQELDQSHSTPTPVAVAAASIEARTISVPQRARKRARQSRNTSSRVTRSRTAKIDLHREDTVMENQVGSNVVKKEAAVSTTPPLLQDGDTVMKEDVKNENDSTMLNTFTVQNRPVGGHHVGRLELRSMQADPDSAFWDDLPGNNEGPRKTRAQLAAETAAAVPSAGVAAKKRHMRKKG